jgi:riboflavin synthase
VFTGIVEEMGSVRSVEARPGATRLEIAAAVTLEGTAVGDSIAVNGVCLTVVSIDRASFAFEAVPETLKRSNLGALVPGARVNLERAVRDARTFGGHYVQGHVDGTATIARRSPDGEAVNLTFSLDPSLAKYLVPKGFVAVDGVSLTVVDAGRDSFSVTLVPHTQSAVRFGASGPGEIVNVEVDVMAKYVERLVEAKLGDLEARIARIERSTPEE